MLSGYYTAGRIFTGREWVTDQVIRIADGRVCELVPTRQMKEERVVSYPDAMIVPAFIDLQIYGARGRLLAVDPSVEALKDLVDYCRAGGAAWCLPTVATNEKEVVFRCIDAVRSYRENVGDEIIGIHLEGPWLNPARRGAHIESLVHPPQMDEVKELLDYAQGQIRMITLAPEVCGPGVIDLLLSRQVIVSAGHSAATYEQAKNAFDRGIRCGTHLYNAMSGLHHRDPGLAAAILDDSRVSCSIIPDGHHVSPVMIRIASRCMGERLFAITDAVTETDRGFYRHRLAEGRYESGGILSGSALTMVKAFQYLVREAGISLEESIRMCSLYPARVMGKDDEWGMIQPGYICRLIVLDNQLELKDILF